MNFELVACLRHREILLNVRFFLSHRAVVSNRQTEAFTSVSHKHPKHIGKFSHGNYLTNSFFSGYSPVRFTINTLT